MSDETAQVADLMALLANVEWTRSPLYRTVTSNIYRVRIGVGDVGITLSAVSESFPGKPNTIEDQVTITMSWPQLKMVTDTLNAAVSVIEADVGKIRVPPVHAPSLVNQRDELTRQVRAMFPPEVTD